MLFIVGCSLAGVARASSPYVDSCVLRLREAPPNNQTVVSTADYGLFLSGLSGGLVADFESSVASLQNLFLDHGSVEEGVDMSTIDAEQATSICVDVFEGLFEQTDVAVEPEECITYLKDTDIDPENGQLEENEYSSFLAAMSVDPLLEFSDDFGELPRLPLEVYSDFSIDGVIQGAEGADYLFGFCARAMLAVKATTQAFSLKANTPSPNSTLAPSASATSSAVTNGTAVPTGATPSPSPSVNSTMSPTATSTSDDTTEATTSDNSTNVGSTPSPSPASTSDSTGGGTSVATTAPPTSTSSGGGGPTAIPTVVSTGTTEQPTISGPDVTLIPTSSSSGETVGPTTLDGATFLPTTLESMPGSSNETGSVVPTPRLTYTPTVSPTILETTISPTRAPIAEALSLKEFNTCKVGLIVSDLNRNDRLEPQEFVRLVYRLAGDVTNVTPLYADLDPIYRSTYESLQSDDAENSEPRLEGTKPGRIATADQRENILWICREVYAAIELYQDVGPTVTGDNSTSTADDGDAGDEITAEFKTQCSSALIIADLNRDDILDEDEYVRFINRLSPDIFYRATTFRQLDPTFKASYHQVASARGITVAGSKPGHLSTTTQRQHLDSVCREANTAIRTIEKNGGVVATASPTRSPVWTQGSSSVETEYFRSCTTAMLIADLDRNDRLSQTEFVRLLNRLTISEFSGMTFETLDPVLQLAFFKLAHEKSYIDVSGSKPGEEPNGTTMAHLQDVCDSVRTSLVTFDAMEAKAPTPAAPIAPPVATPAPTKSPIGDDVLDDCREALIDSDRDRNFLVSEVEFIGFVNVWNSKQFVAFEELPLSFRNGFGTAAGQGRAIDLGATNGSALDDLCFNIVSQGERLVNEDCRPSLYAADIDANGRLDQEEYVYFLELFGDRAGSNFDGLSYVLRDNWDWIVLEREYVDISGMTADFGAENIGHEIRLDYICERTEHAFSVIREGRDSVELEDSCVESLMEADANGDEFIGRDEYLVLVALFSGSSLAGKFFGSLPSDFLGVFDMLRDPDLDMIDVATSAVTGVCIELEIATVDSRASEAFFEQCVVSLQHSDENRDDFLDENEYIQLLYSLAVAFGYANNIPDDIWFEDLNQVLQLNFEVLSLEDTSNISIQGWQTPGMWTEEVFDNLQWVCQNMHDVVKLVSSSEDLSIVAYNSFIISNENGLDAGLVQSNVAWDALNLAYNDLVKEQISLMKTGGPQRLRRRSLAIDGVDENDINLYYIEETRCGVDLPDESKCQVVFGSAKLLLSDEDDPESVAQHYSQTVQDAIDAGALQLKLLLVESSSPLKIEKSSTPLRPVDADLFLFGGTKAPLPAKEEGSMFLALLAGALVSLAIFLTLYYWFYYIRKKKSPAKKEEPKLDESDTYYPPDRTSKSGGDANEFSVQELSLDSPERKSKIQKQKSSKVSKGSTTKDSESHSNSLSSADLGASAPTSPNSNSRKSSSGSKTSVSDISESSKGSPGSFQSKGKKKSSKVALPRSSPSHEDSSGSGSFGDFVAKAANKSESSKGSSDSFQSKGKKQSSKVTSPRSSQEDSSGSGSFGDFVAKVANKSESSNGSSDSFQSKGKKQSSKGALPGSSPSQGGSSGSGSFGDFVANVANKIESSQGSSGSFQQKGQKQSSEGALSRSSPSHEDSSTSGSFGDFVAKAANESKSNSRDVSSDDASNGSFGDFAGKTNNSSGRSKPDAHEDHSQSSPTASDDDVEDSSLSIEEDDEASFDVDESSRIDKMRNSIVSESSQEEDSVNDGSAGSESTEEQDELDGSSDLDESADISLEDEDESQSRASGDESSLEEKEETFKDDDEGTDGDGTASYDEAETLINSTMSMNSKDANEAYEMYRPIVEDLVRQVVPDEIDNVDTMMEQFIGRERELVRTLKNMAGMEDSSDDEFDDEDSESEFYSDDEDGSSDFDGDGSDDMSESASGSEGD